MSNIKLAIRLRPFSDRELKSESECSPVVDVVDDNTVTITNVKVSSSGAGDSRERVRRYSADYTFDSACGRDHPQYASQEKVFDTMGKDVLACLMGGSSACVLAYGQSATGKTHTMMGSDVQPGLIPRLCTALAASESKQISVSFLEIYNERVHDLLAGDEPVIQYPSLPRRRGNARKDLRVREHPERGPYVQNLRRVVVHDAESLHTLVSEGSRRRRTAATRRNATSSRSHALLELSTLNATLHLADLAGSEKASWEGCGGGRQKEGANINKSLVALSNVISALVNRTNGRGRFVPYRDSALTWLLKDCFTGGAAAFIIATVSPSVACYGESASTLRWASRARQLRISPHVRTSTQTIKSAVHLHLQQILAELAKHHIQFVSGKLTYNDKHWDLQSPKAECSKRRKIDFETIDMNPSKPKVHDNQNSESPASSIASGSSDHINVGKQTKNELNKVDKLFGPALERTHSGIDLKVVAPLRHKRRQYKSQEVLVNSKSNQNPQRQVSLQEIGLNLTNTEVTKPNDVTEATQDLSKRHVPLAYDNPRAEIVASVTERLYSKLKKKEEAALSKVEHVVDKKIMEPLSELKICTNARQRLVELSQKAMRHKRRIGIPAHTQTRFRVTRVKDQGIDIQADLEPYAIKVRDDLTYHQNVGTETNCMTPRCKEASVGPNSGSLHKRDSSTVTEKRRISLRNCAVMTEKCLQMDRSTQTTPPRKKAPSIPKVIPRSVSDEVLPVISINIMQSYANEQESTSASDDSLENVEIKQQNQNLSTPDLLTDHNAIDINNISMKASTEIKTKNIEVTNEAKIHDSENINKIDSNKEDKSTGEIFSDGEEYLPRITIDKTKLSNAKDIKNIILGRNENLYPYNIVLSPPRIRPESVNKRTVKFKDLDSSSNTEFINRSDNESESVEYDSTNSLCSESNITKPTNTFVWKKTSNLNNNYNTSNGFFLNQNVYTPVYNNKNTNRYKTSKSRSRIYRDFLGLEDELEGNNTKRKFSKDTIFESDEDGLNEFRQKREFFESKGPSIFNRTNDPFCDFEKKLLKSCDLLDASINKYDAYLKNYHERSQTFHTPAREFAHIRPKEYLNHLVELRKNVVKSDMSSGNASSGSVF